MGSLDPKFQITTKISDKKKDYSESFIKMNIKLTLGWVHNNFKVCKCYEFPFSFYIFLQQYIENLSTALILSFQLGVFSIITTKSLSPDETVPSKYLHENSVQKLCCIVLSVLDTSLVLFSVFFGKSHPEFLPISVF